MLQAQLTYSLLFDYGKLLMQRVRFLSWLESNIKINNSVIERLKLGHTTKIFLWVYHSTVTSFFHNIKLRPRHLTKDWTFIKYKLNLQIITIQSTLRSELLNHNSFFFQRLTYCYWFLFYKHYYQGYNVPCFSIKHYYLLAEAEKPGCVKPTYHASPLRL